MRKPVLEKGANRLRRFAGALELANEELEDGGNGGVGLLRKPVRCSSLAGSALDELEREARN